MHKNTHATNSLPSSRQCRGLVRKRRMRPSTSPARILKVAYDIAIMANEMDRVVVVLTPECELLLFANVEELTKEKYPFEWLVGCYTRNLRPDDIADDLQARLAELLASG